VSHEPKRAFSSACRHAGLEGVTMTEEMLERVYGHHHPDHLRNGVDALSRPRNVRGIQQDLGAFDANARQKTQ